MKTIFALFSVIGILLWSIASLTLDRGEGDRTRLRWATDPNSARLRQTAMYTEQFPGYEISVEAGAMEKLLVQCATGTGPDLIDIYNISEMAGYVQAGLLLDLTPYASEMGFGPEHTYPSLRDGLMLDGKQYRFPANVAVNAMVYNKELFDDHGVPYPKEGWTWDDFIEMGKKFATPGKSGETHLAFSNFHSLTFFRDLLWSHGGSYYRDGGLTSNLDSPEAIQAMQLYHDMIHVHGVIPTPEISASMSAQGGWGSGGITWFSSGKAATILIGRWYLLMVANYPEISGKIGAVVMPRVAGRPSSGYIDARATAVNAASPHAREALTFLQYLASSDYNRLIIDDGDSLPPNPEYAATGTDLVNRALPDPDFHQVFIEAASRARPIDVSPFIDALQAERWLEERISRIENNPGTDVPAQMRQLAREVNQRIRRNLKRNRYLHEAFTEATGQPYHPDWTL